MAGRPASRGGGMTGLHYGLIAFVFVSVAGIGAFIWQFTETNALREEVDRMSRRSSTFGEPREPYTTEAASRNSTAFAVMNDYLKRYGAMIAGNADAVYPSVALSANQAILKAADAHPEAVNPATPMVDAIRRLTSTLTESKRNATTLSDELERIRRENDELTRLSRQITEDFETEVGGLKEDYRQTETQYTSAISEKESQREELQAALDRTSQELQQLKIELEGGATSKDQEIERLTGMVEELRGIVDDFQDYGLDPEAILTKADGKVLRAVPGSDIVYINLGERQSIKVGMGFEVFSQLGASRDVRGKASIEISAVLPNTAECRVTRRSDARPIIEGDIVVNLAYERDRKPKFVVRGEFDLDYDGRPDTAAGGGDRVAAIIEQWGGEVVEEFDESTDFVIVGTAPYVPALRSGAMTPTNLTQVEQRRVKNSDFRDLIKEARSMFIPVITQSQFLFLTGYSNDTFFGR